MVAVTLFLLFPLFGFIEGATTRTYRAAVYEHAVVLPDRWTVEVPRPEALANMMKNLLVYKQQARSAAAQGADILVFPEDGVYGYQFFRSTIRSYLEFIPDPNTSKWSPCSEPDRYPDTEVQRFLSCLAKDNSMYIVANMGDKQPCDKRTDPQCPSDGQYQYNTNVVYDRNGVLIARYHKQNLYFEFQFNTPNTPEYTYFDTPFGRFATFTCFDILFHDPAIPVIQQYNVIINRVSLCFCCW